VVDRWAHRLHTGAIAAARAAFRIGERFGVHVTPNHFYYPIPDTRRLSDALFARRSALVGVDWREAEQLRFLEEVCRPFADEYNAFPHEPTADPRAYSFANPFFSGTDALVLYALVRHQRPRTILEIGAGHSTRVSNLALTRNGTGTIRCIEPYPGPDVARLPTVSALIRRPVQEIDLDVFTDLQRGDILFIDSSHVVRTGGDVPFLFLEVLPRLSPGVLVHLHDIFLPYEYPRAVVREQLFFWSEQYLLHALLVGTTAFEVVIANNFMGVHHLAALQRTFPRAPTWHGGSFWLRRAT